MDVYVERGAKKTFACAVDWPGLCRSARDEKAALETLIAYVPRYRRAVGRAFTAPQGFNVVDRVKGDQTTDYGVPNVAPKLDRRPIDDAELKRQIGVLRKCLDAFARAASAAEGKPLATGPRGGGRDVQKMRAHVLEGHRGYLHSLGGPARGIGDIEAAQAAFEGALRARERGDLPAVGPRGGKRFLVRYALRRAAWHALDHAWEIEDRAR